MTKVWGHSKRASRHSGKRRGEVNKKCDATHSKNEILRVTFFLNDSYDADLICCIFMSVFADGVISFL